MLKLEKFTFNPFAENTYIVYDPATKDGIVVDPGMSTEVEQKQFDRFITEQGIHLSMIINTHMHIDHCLGNNYVAQKYGTHTAACATEIAFGENLDLQANFFGLNLKGYNTTVDIILSDGQLIPIGPNTIEIIAVPGHSPGGISIYDRVDEWVLCGDSLFLGSIGRTDLPGADHNKLIHGIRTRLFTLPETTVVYPGHGPLTTIGHERATNPYVRQYTL